MKSVILIRLFRCLALIGFLLGLNSCHFFLPTPPSPPPPSAKRPLTPTYSCTSPTVAPVVPDESEVLPLIDLLDIALQNSPATRSTWYQAKMAAADVGSARGAYLPTLNFTGSWMQELFAEVDSGEEIVTKEKNAKASLTTTYLLFDFGGRNGNLLSAIAALDSLNWSYCWEVQTVMIQVIQSYYNYINALGTIGVDEATVYDNRVTVEAATARRKTGLDSLSDELQARTSLLQSQILLEQDIGILKVAEATLVQALGLPADTPISVAGLPENLVTEGVCQDMTSLMELAKRHRSDLNAMRSGVMDAHFQIQTARSALLPSMDTSITGSKQSLNDKKFVNAYDMQFNLYVPIFNQFTNLNNLRKAQANLLATQAELDNLELDAFLQVVSDYYELIANSQVLDYSHEYLKVAKKNQEVAFANYKVGINTILDLMTANNALYLARQYLVDAKTQFLTSLANLAYDTGTLRLCDITEEDGVVLIDEEGDDER
ncbi:MAG: Outer membrane protein TolC [Chlamydiae bacterium]|nr:Outer membrane protein TolC [Chlamydiota bacterium]